MSNKPISHLEKLKIATARRLFARIRLDSYIDQNYKEMDSDLVNIIRYYQGSTDLRDEALTEIEQEQSRFIPPHK